MKGEKLSVACQPGCLEEVITFHEHDGGERTIMFATTDSAPYPRVASVDETRTRTKPM